MGPTNAFRLVVQKPDFSSRLSTTLGTEMDDEIDLWVKEKGVIM